MIVLLFSDDVCLNFSNKFLGCMSQKYKSYSKQIQEELHDPWSMDDLDRWKTFALKALA